MKKIVKILIGILLVVYVLLSLLSMKDGYSAERELWGINRKLSYLASHQESTPDYAINQLINRYRAFIIKYNKTIFAKRAELMLGNLYSLRKNYSQARLEYQKAVSTDKELSAQAEVTIAKTYELEGKWNNALSVYKSIIRNYPLTNSGFLIPLYLANHSESANADALVFYQKIALSNPKSKIEYNALRLEAVCQLREKDWPNAVKTMGDLILKYPIDQTLKEAINTINLLCVTKLHNYDIGINIYQQFIQKYPDHPAVPFLKKMVKDLQLLKDKKLIIRPAPAAATHK